MRAIAIPAHGSLGEIYGPAMRIENQAEANAYFAALVARRRAQGPSRAYAELIERSNLGCCAGYYDRETRLRVERLFRCCQPYLGKASEHNLSAEDAFALGQDIARFGRP